MRAVSAAMVPHPPRVLVMADSDGDILADPEGIDLERALEWLALGTGADRYTWSLTSWANSLTALLPWQQRVDFGSSLPVAILHGTWRLLYVPGKFLEVRRLRRLWRIYDVSGLFPRGSILEAIHSRWSGMPSMGGSQLSLFENEQRRAWRGLPLSNIVDSCVVRSLATAELMRRVMPALERIDLTPARWHGVGSIGSRIIKDAKFGQQVARYAPDRQPMVGTTELLPIFLSAYYGGRTETTVAGTWSGITTYRYDLRSAYAWALSHVGPVGFDWRACDQFQRDPSLRMSVWYVSWQLASDSQLGPFPYRHRLRGTGYPLRGSGWYWWPEVRAALDAYGVSAIRVHHGYVSPRSARRPLLAQVARRFQQRRELERAHDPAADLVKTGLAAVYGRLAQRESSGGEPGRFYNPALAGWVTSAIRSRLIDAYAGHDADVVALSTDAILSTTSLPRARLGGGLGAWRQDMWSEVSYIQSGVYRLRQQLPHYERVETATMGVSTLDFDWLLDELTRESRATVYQPWFVPNLLPDLFPDRWERDRCQWIETPVTISPSRANQRRVGSDGVIGMDWHDDYHHLTPVESLGDTDSWPSDGPPAWRGETDPVRLAVASISKR